MEYTGNSTNDLGNGHPTMMYTIPNSNGNSDVTGGHRRKGGKKLPPYDPFQMRDKTNGTNASGALLHLMKSSIGTGILAMPNAFKNAGLIFGLFGTIAIGTLCTHCIYLLVLCSQTLSRRTRRPAIGFADTAYVAFSTGPRRFRPYAAFARGFVNAATFCTYYFGNCIYVIIICASFKQVIDNHVEWHYSIRVWIIGLALPLLPLGIVRSLRLLVPFSALGTTFILIGLGSTIMWVVTGYSPSVSKEVAAELLPDIGSRPWIAPIEQMPLFFATVLLSMENIGTVLPIENSMSQPQLFLYGWPCGVLYAAMIPVVILYAAIGFLGYLRFGDVIEGSLTLNLPNDSFSEAVKIMVALSILFSYGLQFSAPSEIAWTHLKPWLHKLKKNTQFSTNNEQISAINVKKMSSGANTTTTIPINTTSSTTFDGKKQLNLEPNQHENVSVMYYIMRASMILGTFIISAIVPNLAPVISLFGAVFFSILGLFCPAVIHLVTFWEHGDDDDDDSENLDTENHFERDGDTFTGYDNINFESDGYEQWKQQKIAENSVNKRKGMSRWSVVKDIIIIVMTIVALVSGTYASLVDIIHFYGDNPNYNATSIPTTTTGPIYN